MKKLLQRYKNSTILLLSIFFIFSILIVVPIVVFGGTGGTGGGGDNDVSWSDEDVFGCSNPDPTDDSGVPEGTDGGGDGFGGGGGDGTFGGGSPQCSDGIDNDGDGLTDYGSWWRPGDPDCDSDADNSEAPPPDLRVTSFTIPNGDEGEIVTANVAIRNYGGESTGVGFEVAMRVNASSMSCGSTEDYRVFTSALGAGTSRTLTIPGVVLPATAGGYTGIALADSDCAVVESSETNNTRTDAYTVSEQPPPPPPSPSLSIEASPTLIRSGSSSIITWSTTNVNSCVITGPNSFYYTTTSGSVSTGPLTEQSTYTLSCESDAGPATISIIINVLPVFDEF